MARKRIYEIAHELGVSSKDLIAKLDEMGLPGMKAANSVDEDEYALILRLAGEDAQPEAPEAPPKVASTDALPEVRPTAKKAAVKPVRSGPSRPPIVSVLGHIDHGKTTLLDAIRQAHVAAKEAGGITQGVAAYQANLNGRRITFIDTPGHKAFTGMRARGASATDIAILVVAADDGVMTQTLEAIDHIRAAGIPMIVAINKIDKANADVNRVMSGLAEHGLTPEAWGGETITVEISALQNLGVEDLLEMILLVAEMEDLRGDPAAPLEAVIIESHLSAGKGPVAAAVIRDGTLREKDWAVAGAASGRVKALLDEAGRRVVEAKPGDAVQVLGFEDVPAVGTRISIAKSQVEARRAALAEAEAGKPKRARKVMTLDELLEESRDKVELQLILKASSTGGLEAARRELETLSIDGVSLNVLHAGVGTVSESDVLLAASVEGDSIVVGFAVKSDPKAAKLAEQRGIALLTYEIIYDLVAEIEKALKRKLAPEFEEIEVGVLEVRNIFKVPNGRVAGCYVSQGKVTRRSRVRVLRNDAEIFVGEVSSVRRFEEDVREVLADRECGVRIKDFDGIEVGDRLVIFELKEIER